MADRPRKKDPKYCLHKPSGRAYVRLGGQKQTWLGPYDDPASRQRYHSLLEIYHAHGGRMPVGDPDEPQGLKVIDLCIAYLGWAEKRHVDKRTGKPSGRVACIRGALRVLCKLCGDGVAAGFESQQLYLVQTAMKRKGWSRATINDRVNTIRYMFKWGSKRGLIPGGVSHRLADVDGLGAHDRDVPGPKKVEPVEWERVEAVLEHTSPVIKAMIELMWWSGMRPGEVCLMRPMDIDRSGDVWVYRPEHHKTAHYGKRREVLLGPEAQTALTPYLFRAFDQFCFSAAESYRWYLSQRNSRRATPQGQGNCTGSNTKKVPKTRPRDFFDNAALNKAIKSACKKSGVERWTANQLRHAAATRLRKKYGADGASSVLGHSSAALTEAVYAERDEALMRKIAREAG